MCCTYGEHQGFVHVEATLTSNMPFHVKKLASIHNSKTDQETITSLLKQVFCDTCIKQTLQKLTGKQIGKRIANTLDEARLDIAAWGF